MKFFFDSVLCRSVDGVGSCSDEGKEGDGSGDEEVLCLIKIVWVVWVIGVGLIEYGVYGGDVMLNFEDFLCFRIYG